MRLGQVSGQRFDMERARRLLEVISGRAEADPMAHLAMASRELGLRLTPTKLTLSEAVWHAHPDSPVVMWSDLEKCFLIVTYAKTFKVRLARYGNANSISETLSRSALAKRLGLKSVNDELEVGLIQPSSPEGKASIQADHHDEDLSTRYGARTHRKHKKTPHEAHDQHGHHHMPPLRRFLKILRPERRDILWLLIFAIFSGILYLALPLAVDTIVTNLAYGGQTQPYLHALLIVAKVLSISLLLQALIIAFQYYIAELIQRRIFVRTAGDLAHRLPRVKAQSLDDVHGPELVNRFLDVVTVQKNTAYFLLEGINVVASSLIGMVLLSLYHPSLLVFVALLVILVGGGTWLLGRRALKTAIRESRSKYDLVGWFEEIAAFPLMFKGPGGYEMAYQRANMLATEYVHARRSHFGIVFRQISGLLVLSVIASVALLIVGTWLVVGQELTLGQLVASELIMSGIVVSLIKLGKKLEAWYDTLAATDKLGHIFDLETEGIDGEMVGDKPCDQGMRIEARDMGFGYPKGEPLFQERNFEIQPGTRVGLYGPQGSGVSTLLDLLFAVRIPTDGYLAFDGVDSRNWNLERLRMDVQLLRRDEFIDGTIIENLRLGRAEISIEEVRQALEQVGLLNVCLSHPEGLNLRLRVGGTPLSTSQRVSLLFARALVHRPRLLLIDELFDGLDELTFRHLTQFILSGDRPWTVIVATRMQEVLEQCQETIQLTNTGTGPVTRGRRVVEPS